MKLLLQNVTIVTFEVWELHLSEKSISTIENHDIYTDALDYSSTRSFGHLKANWHRLLHGRIHRNWTHRIIIYFHQCSIPCLDKNLKMSPIFKIPLKNYCVKSRVFFFQQAIQKLLEYLRKIIEGQESILIINKYMY